MAGISPDDGATSDSFNKLLAHVSRIELALLQQASTFVGDNLTTPPTAALAQLRLWQARALRDMTPDLDQLSDLIATTIVDADTNARVLAVADLPPGTPPARLPVANGVLADANGLTNRIRTALMGAPQLVSQVMATALQGGVASVIGGNATRLAATKTILDKLAVAGITGYKDSAGRNWSLTAYTEMAVRTQTAATAVDGHVDQLLRQGIALAVVSDSPRECPACRPWERQILSLTGKVGTILMPSVTGGPAVKVRIAGTLAEARARGLFHPNCTHRLQALLPGVTTTGDATHDPDGYDAKQRQRALERKVREWKRRDALALTPADKQTARARVKGWQDALDAHIAENDLKRLPARETLRDTRYPVTNRTGEPVPFTVRGRPKISDTSQRWRRTTWAKHAPDGGRSDATLWPADWAPDRAWKALEAALAEPDAVVRLPPVGDVDHSWRFVKLVNGVRVVAIVRQDANGVWRIATGHPIDGNGVTRLGADVSLGQGGTYGVALLP